MLALASPSASVGSALCTSCHAVSGSAQALEKTSHLDVPCLTCHQKPGVLGAIESVFDGAANLAVWANPLAEAAPAKSSVIDSRKCLLCHPGIVESGDIIDSDLYVDHRHFKNVDISCITCHRGVAHGDKLARGGGMTKNLCIRCHNGINASNDCASCHKTEVEGVMPSDPETALGVAHSPDIQKNHALADLDSCVLCHQKAFCENCHGPGVPHDSNFIYLHGKFASGQISSDAPEDPADRAASAKRVFESKCQQCHGLDRPRTAEYQGAQWEDLVSRMRAKGAALNGNEAALVSDYLVTTGGGRHPERAENGLDGDLRPTKASDDDAVTPGATIASTPEEFCVSCHNQSYCSDCHGNIDMPHRSEWLGIHKDGTELEDIPLCYRCHVNEECIGCHEAHKRGNISFPTGPQRF